MRRPVALSSLARRKVEHVLRLGHVADLNAIENVHAFLNGVDSSPLK